MSISLQSSLSDDHIFIQVSGHYEQMEAIMVLQKAIELSIQHKIAKILIDARDVIGNVSTLERFDIGILVAEQFLNQNNPIPFKIVVMPNELMLAAAQFAETVALNRGVPVKITTDLQAAKDWLNIK